jgi:hypothetical protein
MPYANEGSSAVSHFDIIKNNEVASFLSECSYDAAAGARADEIESLLVNVTSNVKSLNEGVILASDGSPYEAVVQERFPSVRVGFLKFSNVLLLLPDYQRLRNTNAKFIDPVEIARVQRMSQSLSMVLPGAGILRGSHQSSRCVLREKIFQSFQNPDLSSGGETLYDTFVDLIGRMGSLATRNGATGILFGAGRKSPATDLALEQELFVPIQPGFAPAPDDPTKMIYLTDALRVHEAFSDEGSNLECFNRLMTAMEHLLLAHMLRSAYKIDPTVTDNLFAIVDGPLAIFGEPARFHRGLMSLIDDLRRDARERNQPGPLVVGLSKTGKVTEHAQAIDHILQSADGGVTRRDGTWLLPVSDEYRYRYIQPAVAARDKNFGSETYYGQTFILRTTSGKVFDLCLAYPFPSKEAVGGRPFREAKMDLTAYGESLDRAVSLVELMQMDLYENSLIAVHLAHKYSSIAHSPGGRSLDNFVRQVVRPR